MSRSRRSFLKELGIGAALFPTVLESDSESSLTSLESLANGESYWQQVRAQFSFQEDKVPMNAANLCPSSRAVADRVEELTRDVDRDCSFNNRAKFGELRELSRQKVARQLGVSPDEIALVRNTSEANNTVNNGISLEEGDEIVLWDQNHPTNNVAWDVRAARFGLTGETRHGAEASKEQAGAGGRLRKRPHGQDPRCGHHPRVERERDPAAGP